MNLNAAALRLMAEKGLTLSDVAEIVAANEAKSDTTAAERQRRCRANKKGVSHRDVTRDPPIEYNHTPKDNPITANAVIAPRGRKPKTSHRLPDDWEPEPLTADTAKMVAAWVPGRIERELAKFRDYWKAASGRTASKDNWQAAWRYWLRNADERGKNGTANRTSFENGTPRDGFSAALRQAANRPDAGDGFDDPSRMRPAAEPSTGIAERMLIGHQ